MRIGVDLGGTKIEAIALGDAGDELFRQRVPTPREDYAATLAAIAELVSVVERETATRGSVGVGMPGAISPATGLVKNANSTWLNGRPLAEDLVTVLRRPIRLANDANCFALSEAVDGAAAGAGAVFGVIVGTGTGGGVVIDRHVLTGPNAVAGEWGHCPLPWPADDERPGPSCYCGKNGCIETFLSGPGLAHDFSEAAGRNLSPAGIVAAALGGDTKAEAALVRYEDRMARGLATVINLLDPDVIVLGGGLSNLSRLYSRVPALWGRYVFSDRVDTRLVPPRHGDSSGVRGAAWLWERGDESGG
ncbi:MAG: ROK family protein [Vicinamibacteria bacterium]